MIDNNPAWLLRLEKCKGSYEHSDFEAHMIAEYVRDLSGKLESIRQLLTSIVVTEGCDRGVVLLSQEGPTHYDADLKCQVYNHENFSPLGDALIALYDLTNQGQSHA